LEMYTSAPTRLRFAFRLYVRERCKSCSKPKNDKKVWDRELLLKNPGAKPIKEGVVKV